MNAYFKIRRRKNSHGQTIVELFCFLLSFAGFVTIAYYLHSVFEISQKQTMLLRNQAFIELGNHSAFSKSSQGKDSIKDKNARLDFVLGKKTDGTMVDITKNEDFEKAVKGELEVDVNRATKDDAYWTDYRFPRDKTSLVWLSGSNGKSLVSLDLQQTVSIVHNRSIDLKSSGLLNTASTQIASGSLTLEDYIKLANLKIPTDYAMRDNTQRLQEAIRALAKNDPGLSEAAAHLEKTVNAADSLSGSAKAVLINTAISVVMGALSDSLGSAKDGAGGANAGGGQASNTVGQNFFDSVTGNLKSPTAAGTSFANGTLGSGPLAALTAPFRGVATGFSNMTGGFAAGGLGGAFQTLGGIGQLGQQVSFVGSLAGQDMSKVSMASSLLQVPTALSTGIANLQSVSFANDGVKGVLLATSQVAAPITTTVSMVAPEMGVPMGYVSMALGAATAGAGALENLSSVTSGTLDAIQTTKTMGSLVTNIGAAGAGAAGLTGKDGSAFAYVAMAGAGISAAGAVGEMAVDIKLRGEMVNPVTLVKETVARNIENVKQEWNGFVDHMQQAGAQISTNMNNIFKKDVGLENSTGKSLITNIAAVREKTTNEVDNALSRVNQMDLSKANLARAADSLGEMSKVAVNMKYNGDPEMAALANSYMKDIREGVSLLQTASEGKATLGGPNNPNDEILARADESSRKLREMIGDSDSGYFAKATNAQREIKDYERSEVGHIQDVTVSAGMTKRDFNTLKASNQKSNPLANVAGAVGGDAAHLRMVEMNQTAIRDLADLQRDLNGVKDVAARQSDIADKIRLKVAGIPAQGFIVTPDPRGTREDFQVAEQVLRSELSRPDVTGYRRQDLEAAANKLNAIVSDSSRFTSAREQFARIQAEVDERAAAVRRTAASVNRLAGRACDPTIDPDC